MLGHSHFISGLAAGLAVCDALPVPPSLVPVVVGVSAYSAMVPDADHYAAPAARVFGPLSWLLCCLIRALSARTTGVRHRGLSHSLVFALGWGLLAGAVVLAWLPVQVALWVGTAAAVGCATHIAGDLLTVSGCKHVLWPSRVQVSWPYMLRFRTGGTAEGVLCLGMLGAGAVLLYGVVAG